MNFITMHDWMGSTPRRFLTGGIGRLLALGLVGAGVALSAVHPPPDADKHWAFQPLVPVQPPMVRQTDRIRTDLDRFIVHRLDVAGIALAPPADPRTLLRRLYFDLTGLPPSSSEITAFADEMAGGDPEVVSRWIDRLLASPHYGERWGRHWLDVARYSDTKGYVYGREERRFVHAPAYRDWVIQSFNRDLPYDQFLRLQIAADQIVPAGSPELAAMGFITGGRRFLGVTHDIIDDRIDVVTRTTLGLTVACARCHDHKYDPIPTADYYSLYGVFHGADDVPVALASVDDVEAQQRQRQFDAKRAERRREANARLQSRVADYLMAQLEMQKYPEEGFEQILGPDDIIPQSVRRWRDFLHQTRAAVHPIFAPWHRLVELTPAEGPGFATNARVVLDTLLLHSAINPRVAAAFRRPLSSMRDVPALYGELFREAMASGDGGADDPARRELKRFLQDPQSPTVVPDSGMVNLEYSLPTHVTEELWKLQGEVDRRWIELGLPAALILTDRAPEPNPHIFRRGSPSQPGPEVPRQILGILAGPSRQPFGRGSGRLELAESIVDPRNPLTARVLVNRVWQHHFGVGLVATPSDFGLRAAPPTHPELLDWMAGWFLAEGWSIKALHRLILNSAVYQTARQQPPESDPDNHLWSTFPGRRLEFEPMRDAMLAVSGELDPRVGGKAIELLDAGNQRRSVYAMVDRQFLPGVLRTFDFANPDLHVAVRHETTVPQQGLYFLNGPFAAARARTLAERTEGPGGELRIRQLYQFIHQRAPTAAEVGAGLRYIAAAEAAQKATDKPTMPSPWQYGWGEYDEAAGQVRSFHSLPHFTGAAWQGATTLPGGVSGWAMLTAAGGHPGNDRAHACIRRWVAPRDLTVTLEGVLLHEPTEGDGIRGFVTASRRGLLKSAQVHHDRADMGGVAVEVRAGDTIDFVVDIGGGLGFDQFLWAPAVVSGTERWDVRSGFAGPRVADETLSPWAQYAQVLLLTNEFAFVD